MTPSSYSFAATCLTALLLCGAVSAAEPVLLTGRSPHLGPMKGELRVTRQGEGVEVSFKATFKRGATWTLSGRGKLRKGLLACKLTSAGGLKGSLEGKAAKATHSLEVHREGSRYWGVCRGPGGTTWFREALSMTAKDPAPDTTRGTPKERLLAAQRVLRRVDANGDGLINGRRYRNELDATKDPLARAVFEFVDYGNYTGRTSVFGPATRGDVQEGGIGLGYTTRPKHYTSNQTLSEDALTLGLRDLRQRVSSPLPQDLPQQDLTRVLAAAKAAGLLKGTSAAQRYQAIHEAAEALLERIVKLAGEKERKTRKDGARLTQAELKAALKAGSLEALLFQALLSTGKEHWMTFFQRGLRYTRRDEERDELGTVGSVLQHYLLVVGKRARETGLLTQIRKHLTAPAPAGR